MNQLDINWSIDLPIEEWDRVELEDGKIAELDLYSLGIKDLPDSIGKILDVVHINLNDNRLTSLPNSIGKLTRLRLLSLNYNSLINLPNIINGLLGLISINLHNNSKSKEELLKTLT